MIEGGNLNYIRPEDTIMNVSIDYIKLALLYESKDEIQKILCNNFDRKKHFRGKKWDGDVYDFNGYKIIHTYRREFNNCNVLRLSQPTTTVAHDIHDLLIDIRLIIILPDRQADTIEIAHALHPRFLSYIDNNFKDVNVVLNRMIGFLKYNQVQPVIRKEDNHGYKDADSNNKQGT